MNEIKPIGAAKEQIADFVYEAIERTIHSYKEHSCKILKNVNEEKEPNIIGSSENKNYIDHHNACKVVLGHLQLLLKMADWAEIQNASFNAHINRDEIEDILKGAREDIQADRDIYGIKDD